ncbi:MAG: polysaccharide deacetylase family protein [Myxococcales bacterium]|nr:polysaccharide deacetylase family protein [Myxococcales bacterium]
MSRRRQLLAPLCGVLLAVGCVGSNDNPNDTPLDVSRNGSIVNDPIPEVRSESGKKIGTLTLTFEDGPSQYSKDIIDVVAGYGIQATFFWVGSRIDGRRDLLAYAQQKQQQLGNHSYYHDRQVLLTRTDFLHRLRATKDNIGDFDNGRLYYRFPFGESSTNLFTWLAEARFAGRTYVNVGWDIDSSDFEFGAGYPDVEVSTRIRTEGGTCNGQENPFRNDYVGWTQYVARKAKGGVMLFHDSLQITHDYIGEIITYLRDPDYYWSKALSAEKAADYRRYYTCTAVDPDLAFSFDNIYGGTWPSFKQQGRGTVDCKVPYDAIKYGPATTSYEKDIKPLIAKYQCAESGCHNTDRASDYSMLTVDDIIAPGQQARAQGRCDVLRGQAGESYLIDKILGTGQNLRMPLKFPQREQNGNKVNEPADAPMETVDIEVFRKWISEGAPP